MVVDTSAFVAVFLKEPEHQVFADLIDTARRVSASAATQLELVSVLCGARFGTDPDRVLGFIGSLGIVYEPVTLAQMDLAIRGLLTFGKGRHPAGLNLGDCFSYALAMELGEPLLFKGDDFARTDVTPAWRPEGTNP